MKIPSKAGFSLIELMIVVGIIGVLITIAKPSFVTFRAKAQQTEAKATLRSIKVLADAYFVENSHYLDGGVFGLKLTDDTDTGSCGSPTFCNRPNALGFYLPNCGNRRYDYRYLRDASGYKAEATELLGGAGKCAPGRTIFPETCPTEDQWRVEANSTVYNFQNALAECL